jgi:hypothetical protein
MGEDDQRDGGEGGAQEAVEDQGLDVEWKLLSDFLVVPPVEEGLEMVQCHTCLPSGLKTEGIGTS